MSYGAADHSISSGTPALPNLIPGYDSDLTPLSSEDEDENGHPTLNASKLKASIAALRQQMATAPTLQWVVPQPDLVRPGVQEEAHVDTNLNSFERTGVTHLVHAWHAQGHAKVKVSAFQGSGINLTICQEPLIPSLDMCRGSHSSLAVKWYFQATAEVAEILNAYFAVAFPDEHAKYRQAFDAGVWLTEDPGPWLGRAIVYKLQVMQHQDKSDGGPTAIFNVGQYTGGNLYLPTLGLKFL
jgi:hypothetical protein